MGPDTEFVYVDPYKDERPSPNHYLAEEHRYFSAHHLLLETAREAAESPREDPTGQRQAALTSIAMSALTVEALANAVGNLVIERWAADFDRLSPIPKLRLICQAISFDMQPGHEPWQSIGWLVKLRNRIAHPQPEHVQARRWLNAEEARELSRNRMEIDIPDSELEKELTLANAKRAVAAVDALIKLLMDVMPSEHKYALESNLSMSGAYEMPPDV
ncbi:hypothetical protein GCM10007862_34410 [Dyella lipolytica]|uniref:RiboL-PSP-HEPN domain-containing protein n=1 Tax=Dyella lipolytica TaxID=1867835 RepID=A0ABW8IYR0_9GAMM|nr:hypothetical protein [Dyella lipolytica]GLQ48390.1 hypothetical protein GCM10007862_34410 [Dyella lipolytica]